MILLPEMIPPLPVSGLDATLFPQKTMSEPDTSPNEPSNSPRRVAARAAIAKLQSATLVESERQGGTDSLSVVQSQFSEKHAVFGAHLATRTTSAPAGSVVVGAVHKYPTLNVLLKGRILMVSEHGIRIVVAPCMYMQDAHTQKASWVLEDCELTNVIMTPEASSIPEQADQIVREFHTVLKYSDLTSLEQKG